jgi:MoaA/NifB/PqqE/SkfB family radical SAM enzyme
MISQIARLLSAFERRSISFELDLIPLHFENLSFTKLANWAFTESSILVKPASPWGYPTVLQVEPTSRCNLRCKVCPVATGLGRPAGDMDFDLYRRLIDEVKDYVLVLMFWDWGEPFLNDCAFDMIHYARQAGIKVVCSTNGHIFADAEKARAVVEAGLDVLVFSVDGITQETYQRYRAYGNLETVLAGVRNVVSEKCRAGSQFPLVNLRFIVMKHGQHEVAHLREFSRALGVDVLTLRKFHSVPRDQEAEEDLVPDQVQYQLPARTPGGRRAVRVRRNPCKNLWNCPTIHWDGTVCSCFMDYRQQRPLGSLTETSFRKIWRGASYGSLRRSFRKDWTDVALCGECAFGFEGGDVGREANAEAVFFKDSQGCG